MRFTNVLLVALFTAAIPVSPSALAQVVGPQVVGTVKAERLNDQVVKVSGRLLVGVHWGSPAEKETFRPDGIRAIFAATKGIEKHCMIVGSRDGSYSGVVEFPATANAGVQTGLGYNTKFRGELAKIAIHDMALLILQTSQCDDVSDGPVVPTILGSSPVGRTLVAQVNPGDAVVRASLRGQDGMLIGAANSPCEARPEKANVRFSHTCVLQVPEQFKGGAATLVLEVREIGGRPAPKSFTVIMPSQ